MFLFYVKIRTGHLSNGTLQFGRCSIMTWWLDVITTLLTGGILVIFRIWLENKWKDKG